MVTVVDAANLIKNYSSTDFLRNTGESLGEEDERTFVDLLVEQIEFANVILLNKMDLVTSSELATVKAIIRSLNAKAKIIQRQRSMGSQVSSIAPANPLTRRRSTSFLTKSGRALLGRRDFSGLPAAPILSVKCRKQVRLCGIKELDVGGPPCRRIAGLKGANLIKC